MSEMVERVMKAIDGAVADWQPGNQRDIREMAARAAIEAMREPTAEMVDAADPYCIIMANFEDGWRDMIDQALKD